MRYLALDLEVGKRNDPEHDARLAVTLFEGERVELAKVDPDCLLAWHWLTSTGGDLAAFDALFRSLRRSSRPADRDAGDAIGRLLAGKACATRGGAVVSGADELGWPLAYVLAWLSVAGGNSVMPPWVRHQFPEAGRLLAELRDWGGESRRRPHCQPGGCILAWHRT